MESWVPPMKPAELVETRLMEAILEGRFPSNTYLPPERELASQLGVTRPTLREALQRLARDGWIEIHHGKPTRVKDYWVEGNLGVLGALTRYPEFVPKDFIPNLLEIRRLLAPAYTRSAVNRDAEGIVRLLEGFLELADKPADLAIADWRLHYHLTVSSGNPIFTLILNGFSELYVTLGQQYFSMPEARRHTRAFHTQLRFAALTNDADGAEALTRQVMEESMQFWRILSRKSTKDEDSNHEDQE
jgi:GntR family negative regulator for fad regulon and positive regulator of fabA